MLKDALVIVTVMLSVTIGIHGNFCANPERLRTVDMNMAELADRRLNFFYVYKDYDSKPLRYMYIRILKLSEDRYFGIHFTDHLNTTACWSMQFRYISAKNGTMTYFEVSGKEILKWYVLGKTNEGAMLVYQCDLRSDQHNSDERFIVVPSNYTDYQKHAYCVVPSDYILRAESLNQLLTADRDYSFTSDLVKVPYLVKDFHVMPAFGEPKEECVIS